MEAFAQREFTSTTMIIAFRCTYVTVRLLNLVLFTPGANQEEKKFITCGSVYLIAHNPGLAISLLYFCFLLLNKPAVRVQESRIQNRREVAFRSSAI